MAEDRYLEDGAGRTSAQEEPQDHTATILFYPEADRNEHRTLPSFLPSSGWKSCRQGGDVLSVVAFAPRNSAFSYRKIGEEKKKKKNRNHPRFRIQHVRGRRANQVGRQILFFSLPRFFPPSSWLSFRFSCICSTFLTVSLKPASTGEEETLRFTGLSWKRVFLDEYRIFRSDFFLFLSFF